MAEAHFQTSVDSDKSRTATLEINRARPLSVRALDYSARRLND